MNFSNIWFRIRLISSAVMADTALSATSPKSSQLNPKRYRIDFEASCVLPTPLRVISAAFAPFCLTDKSRSPYFWKSGKALLSRSRAGKFQEPSRWGLKEGPHATPRRRTVKDGVRTRPAHQPWFLICARRELFQKASSMCLWLLNLPKEKEKTSADN